MDSYSSGLKLKICLMWRSIAVSSSVSMEAGVCPTSPCYLQSDVLSVCCAGSPGLWLLLSAVCSNTQSLPAGPGNQFPLTASSTWSLSSVPAHIWSWSVSWKRSSQNWSLLTQPPAAGGAVSPHMRVSTSWTVESIEWSVAEEASQMRRRAPCLITLCQRRSDSKNSALCRMRIRSITVRDSLKWCIQSYKEPSNTGDKITLFPLYNLHI